MEANNNAQTLNWVLQIEHHIMGYYFENVTCNAFRHAFVHIHIHLLNYIFTHMFAFTHSLIFTFTHSSAQYSFTHILSPYSFILILIHSHTHCSSTHSPIYHIYQSYCSIISLLGSLFLERAYSSCNSSSATLITAETE